MSPSRSLPGRGNLPVLLPAPPTERKSRVPGEFVPWLLGATAVVLALGGTLVAWSQTAAGDTARYRLEFDDRAREASHSVQARLHAFQTVLHATAALVRGSSRVEPEEWRRFTAALDLQHLEPDVLGLTFLQRDPASGGYRRWTLGDVTDSAISMLEVREDPGIRSAVETACRRGDLTLTPRLQLRRGVPPDSGVLLLLPVTGPRPRASTPALCDSVAGMAVLAFHKRDLVGSALGGSAGLMTQRLQDLDEPRPLADTLAIGDGPPAPRFSWSDTIEFGGRRLRFQAQSTPSYDARRELEPILILVIGTLMSLLAGALVGTETRRRALAQREARAIGEELARTESALGDTKAYSREVESRLTTVVESAMDGIVNLDAAGCLRLLNPAAERMLRCRAEDVLGLPVAQFVPAAFQEAHRERVTDFLSGTERHCSLGVSLPLELQRPDGSRFPIEATVSVAEARGARNFTVIFRDVSERRAGVVAREALEAQMRQAQKLEAIGTLTGGIAHDFNNILGSILGNVDLAEQDLPPGHAALTSVQEVRHAGERARDLMQRMLSFTGQRETARHPIRLDAVAQEVVALLRPAVPAHVAVELELDGDIPTVLADTSQMRQVLMNLCTNSVQALGDRPGTIQLRLQRVAAGADPSLPEALRGADCLALSVVDDGPGMTPEVLRRIFDPFFTTRAVGQGTGLGLSVVHGIVAQHDGRVMVESILARGTTVRVLLPAYVEQPEEAATPAPDQLAGSGERVLLVDDEESLLTLGTRTLRRLGYEPVVAQSPLKALELLREDPGAVDVVLTDYSMPGMSGLQLAEHIVKLRGDMPILLMTGYAVAMDPATIHAAGIRAVLPKPVRLNALAAALAEARVAGVTDGQDPAGR